MVIYYINIVKSSNSMGPGFHSFAMTGGYPIPPAAHPGATEPTGADSAAPQGPVDACIQRWLAAFSNVPGRQRPGPLEPWIF